METWDALRARRNVRTYDARPIPPDDLDRILDAGRRAPSSMNEQPWDFVVVTSRDRLERLARVWRHGGHIATSAAAVAFIVPVVADLESRTWHAFDVGQAAMSMMVIAADVGVGSCHSAIGDQDLARDVLELPQGREVVVIVSFGFPAGGALTPVAAPARRSTDEVVHRETW